MHILLIDSMAQTVACSIVNFRLDYCNAMLYDAPAETLDVLHRAQNNLARVVCQRGGRTNARPLLRSLDWLPVKHRVTYKMAALTPAYLNDLIHTAVSVCPVRSSDAPLLNMPRTCRSFSVAAAHTWNSLSSDIRSCRTAWLSMTQHCTACDRPTLPHFVFCISNISAKS